MDRQAEFLRLFLGCESQLRAFVGSVVPDRHARDDVFQDVALTLWQEFDRYDPQRPFGAWARGVAANKLMQRSARAGRAPRLLAPEAVQALREAYDRTSDAASLRAEALDACVEALPEKSRRLLEQRYAELLPVGKIAEDWHVTAEAVYQSLSRLRTRLAECIRRRLLVREEADG